MSDQFQPDELMTITSIDTLKVLTDSFRLRILEAMGDQPVTAKIIAGKLGISPKKLYYHINMLEEYELIVLVDTQIVSGIVEKWYQIRALSFTIDKSLLLLENPDQRVSQVRSIFSGIFDNLLEDILQAARLGLIRQSSDDGEIKKGNLNLQRSIFRLTEEERDEFTGRLEALFKEYSELQAGGDDGEAARQPYNLLFVLHPLPDERVPAPQDNSEEEFEQNQDE